MIIGEILRWNAKRHPNKTAFVFDGHRYTFGQFLERVNRLSTGFLQMDLKKGDRVALMAQNCHHHLEIFFAAAKVGLILVPINFRALESEILYAVNNAEPRALILSRDYHDRIKTTRNTSLNINGIINFANTLLIPIAALLLANRVALIELFG